ncbi:4-alpha-glucanotransferase dpe2 [Cymbomonas tetramitiformis]|uniref:4-alpha-glucanotransferase dpe2 n=1 Tax=Cymbomonas tetramitiformis TaxID=36881 RepID=A0AAE0KQ14_9CHLO|nr:4-alpha-glucanotransferase dpe2 [Cymbomonas tetramitiformis]
MSAALSSMSDFAGDEAQVRQWTNTGLRGGVAAGFGASGHLYDDMQWAEGRVHKAALQAQVWSKRRERREILPLYGGSTPASADPVGGEGTGPSTGLGAEMETLVMRELEARAIEALVLAQTLQSAAPGLETEMHNLEPQQLTESVDEALKLAAEALGEQGQQRASAAWELGLLQGRGSLCRSGAQDWWPVWGGTVAESLWKGQKDQSAAAQLDKEMRRVQEAEREKMMALVEVSRLQVELQHVAGLQGEAREAKQLQLTRATEQLQAGTDAIREAVTAAVIASRRESQPSRSYSVRLAWLQGALQAAARECAARLGAQRVASEDSGSDAERDLAIQRLELELARLEGLLWEVEEEARALEELGERRLELKRAELAWGRSEVEAARRTLAEMDIAYADTEKRVRVLAAARVELADAGSSKLEGVEAPGDAPLERTQEEVRALDVRAELEVISQSRLQEQKQLEELERTARAVLIQAQVLQAEFSASAATWTELRSGRGDAAAACPPVAPEEAIEEQADEMVWQVHRVLAEMAAGRRQLGAAEALMAQVDAHLVVLAPEGGEQPALEEGAANAGDGGSLEGGEAAVDKQTPGSAAREEMITEMQGALVAAAELEELQAYQLEGMRARYAQLSEQLLLAEEKFLEVPTENLADGHFQHAAQRLRKLRAQVAAADAQVSSVAQCQAAVRSVCGELRAEAHPAEAAIREQWDAVEVRASQVAATCSDMLEVVASCDARCTRTAERMWALEVVMEALSKRADKQGPSPEGGGDQSELSTADSAFREKVLAALEALRAEHDQLAATMAVQAMDRDAATARVGVLGQLWEHATRELERVWAHTAGAGGAAARLGEVAQAMQDEVKIALAREVMEEMDAATETRNELLAAEGVQVQQLQADLASAWERISETRETLKEMLRLAEDRWATQRGEHSKRTAGDVGALRSRLAEARESAARMRGTQVPGQTAPPAGLDMHNPAEVPRGEIQAQFSIQYATDFGVQMMLLTSAEDWDPKRGRLLQWGPGHIWSLQTSFPAGSVIQYKYITVRVHGDGWVEVLNWQQGNNRVLVLPARHTNGEMISCDDVWSACPVLGKVKVVNADGRRIPVSNLLDIAERYYNNQNSSLSKQSEGHLDEPDTSVLRAALDLLEQDDGGGDK